MKISEDMAKDFIRQARERNYKPQEIKREGNLLTIRGVVYEVI